MAERNSNYDALRVAAAFAVVWLHTSAAVVTRNPGVQSSAWWTGNIADAMSRWGVPVFVMVSGALLLSAKPDTDPIRFYRRRAERLLIPLMFWSAFYLCLQRFASDRFGWSDVADELIHGRPYMHLWYLYMLVGLYAVTPFLQRIAQTSSRPLLFWFFCGGFALASLESTLAGFSDADSSGTFLPAFLNYIPYFVAGYYYKVPPLSVLPSPGSSPGSGSAPPPRAGEETWRMVAFAIASALAIAAVTAALFVRIGPGAWEITYAPLNPLVILMSVCVFRAGVALELHAKRLLDGIGRLAPLTLGIYLVHPFWLWLLARHGIDGTIVHPLAGIPGIALLVFALSAVTAAALSALPWLRRTVQ